MTRFPLLVLLAIISVTIMAGTAAAESPATTATPVPVVQADTAEPVNTSVTTIPATTLPDRVGGSIYFETNPRGASVWFDNTAIGTTPFTYYTDRTGTREVRMARKGYLNYTGYVNVEEGKRVVFSVDLTQAPRDLPWADTPAETTPPPATTLKRSTISVPTPWQTATESPIDPALAAIAVALAFISIAIRRQ